MRVDPAVDHPLAREGMAPEIVDGHHAEAGRPQLSQVSAIHGVGVHNDDVERMARRGRQSLLKIPAAAGVRSGQRLDFKARGRDPGLDRIDGRNQKHASRAMAPDGDCKRKATLKMA